MTDLIDGPFVIRIHFVYLTHRSATGPRIRRTFDTFYWARKQISITSLKTTGRLILYNKSSDLDDN